jgi:hypothetical protein
MLRLKKKHAPKQRPAGPPPDARRILAQQSVGRAVLGGVAVVLVLGWLWATVSVATGKVFPWVTILIGGLVGFAIRHYGRGIDWRYPVIAALLAWSGAYVANLIIGIVETGRYIEAASFRVLLGLTGGTMENFFANTINPTDHIYAFCAAGLAAFLANRRLNRYEVLAVRNLRKDKS